MWCPGGEHLGSKCPKIQRDSIRSRPPQSLLTRKFIPATQRIPNRSDQIPSLANPETIRLHITEFPIHAHQVLIGPFSLRIIGMRNVVSRSQFPALAFPPNRKLKLFV